MDDLTTPESAANALSQLYQQQSSLIAAQNEANELKRKEVYEAQRANDLAAKDQELKQIAENRREHRLNEVLQRLIKESEARGEAVEVLKLAVSRAAALDESLNDLVDIILDNDKALLQAMHSLLSRNNANTQDSETVINLRYQLTTHVKNLQNLKVRAARHGMDVPTALANEIEEEEFEIAKLREVLSNQ